MQQNAAVFSLPEVELEGKMVEKWVFEQSCRFGLHLLKTILAGLDEELCRNRPSGWRHKGYEERTVQTALGKLSFSRRIYVNQFSCQRRFAFDPPTAGMELTHPDGMTASVTNRVSIGVRLHLRSGCGWGAKDPGAFLFP